MKRKILAVLLASTMIISLVGCGNNSSGSAGSDSGAASSDGGSAADDGGSAGSGAASSEGGHTLSLAAWDASFNIPAMQAAADDYKANVDPEFELVIAEQSQSSDIENQITLAGSAGDYSELWDIVLFQDHWFQRYAADYPDVFVPVDDADVDWNDFSQEKLSFSTVNGTHYGFPVDNGTVIFAYRVDILEQCGYTIDDMTGISWKEFIEIGEKVYAETGKYLLSMDGDGNDLIYMMLQAEGQSQFKDGKPNIVNNPDLVEIVNLIVEMAQKNVLYLANDWSDYTDQTIVGDMVAGVMNGNWIIPTIQLVPENSGKWEITSMPTIKGGEGYASNGGSSLYITSNCKNPELAKSFLAYTFGGSTVTYDAALKNGGVITTCISAGQSAVYNEGVAYFNDTPIYAQIVEMGSHVPVVEQSDFHYTCRQYIAAAIINILQNGADTTTALQEAEDQLNFEMGN